MSDIPPYLQAQPDLQIPIPNTHHRLPLSWSHVIAIRKLMRFFGRIYRQMQQTGEQEGIDKYRTWMMVLLEMDTTIREGEIYHLLLFRWTGN